MRTNNKRTKPIKHRGKLSLKCPVAMGKNRKFISWPGEFKEEPFPQQTTEKRAPLVNWAIADPDPRADGPGWWVSIVSWL